MLFFCPPQNPTTSFLTATTLIYANGAGITVAAYTKPPVPDNNLYLGYFKGTQCFMGANPTLIIALLLEG